MLTNEDKVYLTNLGYSDKEIEKIESTEISVSLENGEDETSITNNFAITLLNRQEFLYAYSWAVFHERTCRIGSNGLNIFFKNITDNKSLLV